jgi:hypothetical protein
MLFPRFDCFMVQESQAVLSRASRVGTQLRPMIEKAPFGRERQRSLAVADVFRVSSCDAGAVCVEEETRKQQDALCRQSLFA